MQKGVTLWFTGLPCSGKTVTANLVAEKLRNMGLKVEQLDGDIVRESLTKDLGFSKEDRFKNIERVTFVAKLLTRNGVIVTAAFVSPYNEIREMSRREIGEFILIYVKCSLEECIRRDAKGMYKKAIAGEIKDFTGISDPFEEPKNPEIVIETDKMAPEECTKIIIDKLRDMGYIKNV